MQLSRLSSALLLASGTRVKRADDSTWQKHDQEQAYKDWSAAVGGWQNMPHEAQRTGAYRGESDAARTSENYDATMQRVDDLSGSILNPSAQQQRSAPQAEWHGDWVGARYDLDAKGDQRFNSEAYRTPTDRAAFGSLAQDTLSTAGTYADWHRRATSEDESSWAGEFDKIHDPLTAVQQHAEYDPKLMTPELQAFAGQQSLPDFGGSAPSQMNAISMQFSGGLSPTISPDQAGAALNMAEPGNAMNQVNQGWQPDAGRPPVAPPATINSPPRQLTAADFPQARDGTLRAEIESIKQRQSSGVFTAAPATDAMAARGNDGTQAVPVGTQPPPQAAPAPSRANVAGNPFITGGQLSINGSPSWANPAPPKPQAPAAPAQAAPPPAPKPQAPAAPAQAAPPPALGSNPGGVNNAQINNTWQNLQPTHTREVKGGVLQPPKPIGGAGGGWGTTGGLQPSSPTGKGKPVVGSGARPNIFGPR